MGRGPFPRGSRRQRGIDALVAAAPYVSQVSVIFAIDHVEILHSDSCRLICSLFVLEALHGLPQLETNITTAYINSSKLPRQPARFLMMRQHISIKGLDFHLVLFQKNMRILHESEIQIPIPAHHQVSRLFHELRFNRRLYPRFEERGVLPSLGALHQIFSGPVPAHAHHHFFRFEPNVPPPCNRIGGPFEEEGEWPRADEAEYEEVESHHSCAAEDDPDLLASRSTNRVNALAVGIAEDGLEEGKVFGGNGVDSPEKEGGDSSIDKDGEREDLLLVVARMAVDVSNVDLAWI